MIELNLKPCPFCGTQADHSIVVNDIVWTSKGDSSPNTFDGCSFTVRVFCPECGIEKTDHFVCGSLTLQIIENCCNDVFCEWNRRNNNGI